MTTGFAIAEMPIESMSVTGQLDEFSKVIFTDDGLIIEGMFSGSVGITWAELSRVLEHPYAKVMLEEADMIRGG